jgi:tetratricopeptide (TPR) repeat protein
MREPLMQRSTLVRGLPFLAGCLLVAAGCSTSNDGAEPPVTESNTTATSVAASTPGTNEGGSMQDVAERQRQIDSKRKTASVELLKQGRELAAAGRFEEARKTFFDAYAMDVSNRDAALELDRMNAILGRESMGAPPAARDAFESGIAKHQQAVTEARLRFNLGAKARSEGNYDAAVQNLEKALLILKVNPSIDADFNEASVKAALDGAKAERETAVREAERRRLEDVASIERKREDDERARVARQVEENYRQAVDLFKREKFAECRRTCDDVLHLDFAHAGAKELKEAARRAEIDAARGENIASHREQWKRWIEEVTEIRIPQTDTVKFPSLERWNQLTANGPIDLNPEAAKPSEVDEEINRKLAGTMLPSVDWSGKPLKDALAFVRNTTNVNVYVEKAVDEKVPEADRVLSLTFENISAAAALKLAVESLKLKYLVEGGVVKITTPEELAKRKLTNFYEVRDLTGKIPNHAATEINLNVSGAAPPAAEEDTEENRQIEAERLIEIVRTSVDKASWDDGTGNTVTDKNGTLVIRQTAENHRAIRKLLGDLRKTTGLQVAIESRFISVENNFLRTSASTSAASATGRRTGRPGTFINDYGDDFDPATSAVGSATTTRRASSTDDGHDGDLRSRVENTFTSGARQRRRPARTPAASRSQWSPT